MSCTFILKLHGGRFSTEESHYAGKMSSCLQRDKYINYNYLCLITMHQSGWACILSSYLLLSTTRFVVQCKKNALFDEVKTISMLACSYTVLCPNGGILSLNRWPSKCTVSRAVVVCPSFMLQVCVLYCVSFSTIFGDLFCTVCCWINMRGQPAFLHLCQQGGVKASFFVLYFAIYYKKGALEGKWIVLHLCDLL